MSDFDEAWEQEGGCAYADAGLDLDKLAAEGFFDCVTDAIRAKVAKQFAKYDAARQVRLNPTPPVPTQGDLFA